MKVLVCGGRDFNNYELLSSVLDEISPNIVVTGGAKGADTLAAYWAATNKVESRTYHADWGTFGSIAGPLRNKVMLLGETPHLVVAFPGGKGTANMVQIADKYGFPIRFVYEEVDPEELLG